MAINAGNINSDITNTLKETKHYRLEEGGGNFKGHYRIVRKNDTKVTSWYSKQDGKNWAMNLKKCDRDLFDKTCATYKYQ